MHFINPKNDLAFKRIFGDSKKTEILISFLNSVLELPRRIVKVDLVSPYQVPRIKDLKYTSLDVKAVDELGREFIVEMQVEGNESFGKRATYYLAKTYVEQIKIAEDYQKLKPAYFIGILNFNLFDGDSFLTRHIMINQETKRQDLKEFEFNFIELKKFNKSEDELSSIINKWIFFIKNAGELNVIPACITESEILEAFNVASQINWSKEELNAYDYWSGKKGDAKCHIETAVNKERRKAQKIIDKERKKAEEERKKADKERRKADEEKRNMIAAMNDNGLDENQISTYTSLSLNEIKEVLKNKN